MAGSTESNSVALITLITYMPRDSNMARIGTVQQNLTRPKCQMY